MTSRESVTLLRASVNPIRNFTKNVNKKQCAVVVRLWLAMRIELNHLLQPIIESNMQKLNYFYHQKS